MRRIAVFLILLLTGTILPAAGTSPVDGLVAAERAFAALAGEKGVKPAFVAFLAQDAVIFRPGPVNGQEHFAKLPTSDVLLEWEPVFADISTAGDMGYTTGPWTLTRTSEAKQIKSHGQYISVWKKLDSRDDTSWRVAIDHGISHPQEGPITAVDSPPPTGSSGESGAESIDSIEAAFEKACRTRGLAACYKEFMAPTIRLYRNGSLPSLGNKAAADSVSADSGEVEHDLLGTGVSSSRDLGYSWGTLRVRSSQDTEGRLHNFIRIWKLSADGSWTIVADIVTPYPPPAD